jgi:hypothetical protein
VHGCTKSGCIRNAPHKDFISVWWDLPTADDDFPFQVRKRCVGDVIGLRTHSILDKLLGEVLQEIPATFITCVKLPVHGRAIRLSESAGNCAPTMLQVTLSMTQDCSWRLDIYERR